MSESKRRILCLEDDLDTCELTTILLQAEGYEVVTASTSADAERLVGAAGFALYIVDQHLPGGAGLDFIRGVRRRGDATPILVHSAAAYKREIDAAVAAGADEYLVKPNGWTKLTEAVEALLQRGSKSSLNASSVGYSRALEADKARPS